MGEKSFAEVEKNLRERGFGVKCFETAAEAAAYLDSQIDGQTVGFGGSVTLEEMGLYDLLSRHNQVYWHWQPGASKEEQKKARFLASEASVYLSSVNGLAETGEIINIDGTGNRVAAMFYGHKKVYLIAGENKLAEDYDRALWRARNIASPLNAKRLGVKTPCAVKGDRCYDCKSPERICRGLAVLWDRPKGAEYEVILIHEKLGY